MADVVVKGDTSGAVTLSAPAVAGTVTVTLPSTSGTMAVLPTATGVLAESAGGTGTTTGYYGFKNRIINGAMVIDQRNAGASVTPTTSNNIYPVDRFVTFTTQSSKYTAQQNAGSVTPPAGFSNYLGCTVGASANVTVAAGDFFGIKQAIEGFNTADFRWGTANAQTVTLSFWVRSSLTGTFGGSFYNGTFDRSYPFSYTISSANTWEQKSITIVGDTSGTWLTTNGIGLNVWFNLGSGSTYNGTAGAWAGSGLFSATGSTNLITTNSATFYITGVQLEKGSTATSFDYRPYGTELQLCQRYFNTVKAMNGTSGGTTTTMYSNVSYPEMRAAPTYAVTGAIIATDPANASYTQSSGNVSVAGGSYSNGAFLAFGNFSGMTANRVIMLNTATTYLTLSAEL